MRRNRTFAIVVLLCVIGAAGYTYKVAYHERYVWPDDLEDMQDLPPPNRSGWPVPPKPFTVEKQTVTVATPEGMQARQITYHVNSIGMDLVAIAPGSFYTAEEHSRQWVDDPEKEAADEALHKPLVINPGRGPVPTTLTRKITITRGFYIGAFEVTNAQFEQFDPSHRERRPKWQQGKRGDHHPVEPVTWREAVRFAHWLSAREGREYRLPTEGEWELAARAGTQSRLYWGEAFWDRSKANLGGLHSNDETAREDGYKQTAPVGSYPANPWGLYDMVGNSYEWVADWNGNLMGGHFIDPTGPATGKCRTGKGGGWTTRPYAMATSERDGNNPADLRDARGFRLLTIEDKSTEQK